MVQAPVSENQGNSRAHKGSSLRSCGGLWGGPPLSDVTFGSDNSHKTMG